MPRRLKFHRYHLQEMISIGDLCLPYDTDGQVNIV